MDDRTPPIYLLRHGETAWNVQGRYQGRKDSPLTDRGRRQVAELGRLLASELGPQREPLLAYVSPLGRTQETADILARHVTLDRIDEPRLAEVSLGTWGRLVRGVFLGLEQRTTLELPVPQDAVYELVGGSTRSVRELRP